MITTSKYIDVITPAGLPASWPADKPLSVGYRLANSQQSTIEDRRLVLGLPSTENKTSTPAVTSFEGKSTPYAIAKDIAQGTARTGASVGLTLTSPFTGKESISPENFDPEMKKRYEIIFGKEPIKSLQTRIAESNVNLQSKGLGMASLPLSVLGVGAMTALDFTGSGAEKNVIKLIPKITKIAEAEKLLKSINVAEDLIPDYAKFVVRAKTTKEAEALIGNLKKIQETTKVAQPVSKDLSPLTQEAKKYKSAEEFVNKQRPVYHGSRVPLKSFSDKKGGVFFTEEYADATGFAGSPDNVYEGYLNFKKPLIVDAKGAKWDKLNNKYGKSTQEVIENAKGDGYDGVIFKNVVDNIADTADYGEAGTIYYAYKPKTSFLNESQLTDIWNEGNKIKTPDVGVIKKVENVFLPPKITKIKRTIKNIVRETSGQIKDDELKFLNTKLSIQEQAAKKGASAGKKEAIENLKIIQDERNFLASIKQGILDIFEKEKNAIRKQIGFQRFTNELDSNVLSRMKEKNEVAEWSNATKQQLQNVLDDLKTLQKGDTMVSKAQVESLKEFGIKNWTTKREAVEILGDVANWKNKTAKFFDFFKTIDQKIEKTAGKDAEKVKDILTRPRAKAVTEMFKEEISLKIEMKDMLDGLKINNKSDRALIMRYGENRISLEKLKKETSKWQEIIKADDWFRKKYDTLLEDTNKELSRFYQKDKLIPKRQDYYTHSQELGKIWDLLKNKGGDISPVLEQVSEFTKPNRKFNPFALKRKGGLDFVEDAGKAFEAYLNPILHNKYLTESIVRHRGVADILAHKTIETKNINQFIFSLRDVADSLAGKTNPFDRALMNRVIGRKPIQLINTLTNRMGKNRILGNVGSALMQISGIPNSVLKNNIIRTSKGLLSQAFSPLLGKNDPLLKSSFLLRRYGEKGLQHGETVFKTNLQKGEQVLAIPFEVIEKNITKSIWRASFDNASSMGYEGLELMTKADEITASVVGSRAIGEKALAFESGVLSLPLQFQLEVNAFAQLVKEQIIDNVIKNPIKAIRAAIETTITLFLFNTLFEKTMGRTPLPDPIRAVGDVIQSDSFFEGIGRIAGEGLSSVAGGQFIANLLPDTIKKKYFGRSEVGIYPGGIPIASALQGTFTTPTNMIYDFVLPYGGGQLKKILQGVEGLDKMGSYNKAGKLQFPINQNQWLQVILFGKYSTKEAKEYFDKQRTPLSDKQTVEYFLRTQKGENPQKVYNDIAKGRIKGEYEREIEKEIIKKIKSKPEEGLALLQLWKKQNIVSDKMENNIIDKLK